jgi:hypothetical protein
LETEAILVHEEKLEEEFFYRFDFGSYMGNICVACKQGFSRDS